MLALDSIPVGVPFLHGLTFPGHGNLWSSSQLAKTAVGLGLGRVRVRAVGTSNMQPLYSNGNPSSSVSDAENIYQRMVTATAKPTVVQGKGYSLSFSIVYLHVNQLGSRFYSGY